jgi:predicted transcriptional regulator
MSVITPPRKTRTMKKTPTKKTTKKPARKKATKVTGAIAVLSALSGGAATIKEIAKGTRMTSASVSSAMSRLIKEGRAKRTNAKAKVGTVGTYKITGKGSTALRRAKKDLGL